MANKDDKEKESSSLQMPDISVPDMSAVQTTVRSGIRRSVETANETLASLHGNYKSLQESGPLRDLTKTVTEQGSKITGTAMAVYDRRHEYGPHLVAGSAVLVGGVFLARRGKISGALGGALAGSAMYQAIYNPVSLDDLPEVLFGKE